MSLLILLAMIFSNSLEIELRSEIGLQFEIKDESLPFLGIGEMCACFHEGGKYEWEMQRLKMEVR